VAFRPRRPDDALRQVYRKAASGALTIGKLRRAMGRFKRPKIAALAVGMLLATVYLANAAWRRISSVRG